MGAGAIVALIGIWSDANWLVNIAIVLLFAGFVLRFVGGGGAEVEDESEMEGTEDVE